LKSFLQHSPDLVVTIFSVLADKFDELSPGGVPIVMEGALRLSEDTRIRDILIQDIAFSSRVRIVKQSLKIPSVVAYDDPNKPLEERSIFVENVDLGDFQITKHVNNVAVAVDLTNIPIKPNCLFRYVSFDLGRVMTMKRVEFFGKPKIGMALENLHIGILRRRKP
nr:hypothetical protein [Syntrophorhabdaceae bacterium]